MELGASTFPPKEWGANELQSEFPKHMIDNPNYSHLE